MRGTMRLKREGRAFSSQMSISNCFKSSSVVDMLHVDEKDVK